MQPIPPLPTLQDLLAQVADLTGAPAVIAACLAATILMAARDWRLVLAAFMTLYLSLALLTATMLPPEWALLRVIVGGMVSIMWYLSAQRVGWGGSFLPFRSRPGIRARPLSSTTLFRTIIALTVAVVLLATRLRLPLPPLPPDLRLVATWLVVYALFGLALGDEALQTGVALLMWLSASHLSLTVVRQDAWLIWLLSSVELLIGLAVAYLMIARGSAITGRTDEERR